MTAFSELYKARSAAHGGVYPTEWVIRTFLGRYPRLAPMPPLAGASICDIGFGDGRNFPLFLDAGMRVSGVEIDEEIVALARTRFGDSVDALKVGRNASIPFEDSSFDFALACHSCYYLDGEDSFDVNLLEFSRILKPGGVFVFSAPHPGTYIFDGAAVEPNGVRRIERDLFGPRAGLRMQCFETAEDLERRFFPRFRNIQTGLIDDDYYGIRVKCFICAAVKAP